MGLSLNATVLIAFLLALVRAGAWMIAMPAFSDIKVIPPIAIACSAAGLAILAAPEIPVSSLPTDVPGLLGAIVLQALTGAAMGFVVNLILQAFTAAGGVIDLAGGLNLPGAVDPLSTNQTPMVGQFYQQVALLMLFGTGGYLEIVAGFLRSFKLQSFDLGSMHNLALVLTADLATLWTSALEMAGPVLLVLFTAQIALALLSRAAPQLNVWALGMPLQIFLTLSFVAIGITVFPAYLTGAVSHAVNDVGALFGEALMPASDRHARTEKPTPKRKKEARDKGQVARSPDITAFAGLLGASMLLPALFSASRTKVLAAFSQAMAVAQNPSAAGAEKVFGSGLASVVEVILPLAGGLALLGSIANVAQVGLHLSGKGLSPQFSRISPKAGLKRLFGASNGVNLLKQLLKVALLGGITYSVVNGVMHAVPASSPEPLIATVSIGATRLLSFIRTVAVLGVGLGLTDFLYQRKHLLDQLKMTKQEVKDEARQREGDPAMKAEIRKRGYQIARSKTLAAVRGADVVIANPTHFAVALRYDKARAAAPVLLAKGEGSLALRMKEEAARALIPVVEDPPLARYLFATTEVGRTVPAEIYVAVARLLAFIYSLPPTFAGGSIRSYPHSSVPYDPADGPRPEEGVLVGAGRPGDPL